MHLVRPPKFMLSAAAAARPVGWGQPEVKRRRRARGRPVQAQQPPALIHQRPRAPAAGRHVHRSAEQLLPTLPAVRGSAAAPPVANVGPHELRLLPPGLARPTFTQLIMTMLPRTNVGTAYRSGSPRASAELCNQTSTNGRCKSFLFN